MTPKRRAFNLSVIFACLCFSKSLLIKNDSIRESYFFDHDLAFVQCLFDEILIIFRSMQSTPALRTPR